MLIKFKLADGSEKKLRTHLDLTGKPLTFGRGEDADIGIDDPMCSRIHCAIRSWDEIYVIRDMNSSNGTFVNGQKVRVAELRPGDVVRIGDTEFSFETEGTERDRTVLKSAPPQG